MVAAARLGLQKGVSQMIYCYGADPFDGSPSSNALHKQLKEAGFKLSELKAVDSLDDVPVGAYCLALGASAFRELTGSDLGIKEARGEMHAGIKKDVLVFPTYAPGYLYRNPDLMWQWKDDLELFRVFINFDLGK